MKSGDLSSILSRCSDLLNLYPGKDIDFVLDDLFKLKTNQVYKNSTSNIKKSSPDDHEMPNNHVIILDNRS